MVKTSTRQYMFHMPILYEPTPTDFAGRTSMTKRSHVSKSENIIEKYKCMNIETGIMKENENQIGITRSQSLEPHEIRRTENRDSWLEGFIFDFDQ